MIRTSATSHWGGPCFRAKTSRASSSRKSRPWPSLTYSKGMWMSSSQVARLSRWHLAITRRRSYKPWILSNLDRPRFYQIGCHRSCKGKVSRKDPSPTDKELLCECETPWKVLVKVCKELRTEHTIRNVAGTLTHRVKSSTLASLMAP